MRFRITEPETLIERIARAFHEEYERRAPGVGWETQLPSRVPYEQLPAENRRLMEAVVGALIAQRVISSPEP